MTRCLSLCTPVTRPIVVLALAVLLLPALAAAQVVVLDGDPQPSAVALAAALESAGLDATDGVVPAAAYLHLDDAAETASQTTNERTVGGTMLEPWNPGDAAPALLVAWGSRTASDEETDLLRRVHEQGGTLVLAGELARRAGPHHLELTATEAAEPSTDLPSAHELGTDLVEWRSGLDLVPLAVERRIFADARLHHLANGFLEYANLTVLGLDDGSAVRFADGRLEVLDGAPVLLLDGRRARPVRGDTDGDTTLPGVTGVSSHLLLAGGAFDLDDHVIEPAGSPSRGHLLASGGALTPSLLERFVGLAGGDEARIAIVSLGHAEAEDRQAEAGALAGALEDLGAAETRTVTAGSPGELDAPQALDALRRATGVVFGGGDQRRHLDLLRGSSFEEGVWRRFESGAVILGASAGAAILGERALTGDLLRMEQAERAAEEGRSGFAQVDLGDVELRRGLALADRVVLDQHFVERARGNRLLAAVLEEGDLIGIGVDTWGTLWLRPDGTAEILGEAQATIVMPPRDRLRGSMPEHRPGTWRVGARGLELHIVPPGVPFRLTADGLQWLDGGTGDNETGDNELQAPLAPAAGLGQSSATTGVRQ